MLITVVESFPRMGNTPSEWLLNLLAVVADDWLKRRVMFTLVLMVAPAMAGLWRSLTNVP